MNEWIDVKERLPENDDTVIANYQCRGGAWRISEVIFDGYDQPDHLDKDAWYVDGYVVERVTHWMPLPDPPKTKE